MRRSPRATAAKTPRTEGDPSNQEDQRGAARRTLTVEAVEDAVEEKLVKLRSALEAGALTQEQYAAAVRTVRDASAPAEVAAQAEAEEAAAPAEAAAVLAEPEPELRFKLLTAGGGGVPLLSEMTPVRFRWLSMPLPPNSHTRSRVSGDERCRERECEWQWCTMEHASGRTSVWSYKWYLDRCNLICCILIVVLHRCTAQEDLRELAGLLQEVSFCSGENIVTQGEPADCMYLIKAGAAHAEKGQEVRPYHSTPLTKTTSTRLFSGGSHSAPPSHIRRTQIVMQYNEGGYVLPSLHPSLPRVLPPCLTYSLTDAFLPILLPMHDITLCDWINNCPAYYSIRALPLLYTVKTIIFS